MSPEHRVIWCALELREMIDSAQSGLECRGKDLKDCTERDILELGLGGEVETAVRVEETKSKYTEVRTSVQWVTGGVPAWEWQRSKCEPGQTVNPGVPRSGLLLYLMGTRAPEDPWVGLVGIL